MPYEIVMPKLGLNMTEGMIAEWYKEEGDIIKKGDKLFGVETEKVQVDAEALQDGILARIVVPSGVTVPVKTVVALMVQEGEELPEELAPQEQDEAIENKPSDQKVKDPSPQQEPVRIGRILATPVAKRLAKENGISLSEIQGSGKDGKIVQEDVEQYLENGSGKAQKKVPISGVRAKIAEHMAKSLNTTAQFTLHRDADVTEMVEFRSTLKVEKKPVPSYNAIIAYCAAAAIKDFPFMNAREEEGFICYSDEVNIGLAIDTEKGLKVMNIRHANKKSLLEISEEMTTLAERIIQENASPDELSGSTFTITNLGAFGVDTFTPILNWPELAILGVGRIQEKLVLNEGKVAERFLAPFSLTIDHRLIDGAPAARFLNRMLEYMDNLKNMAI